MQKSVLHRLLPILVSISLSGGIGYTLFDRFGAAPATNGNGENETPREARPAGYPRTTKGSAERSRALAGLHLFGEVPVKKTRPPPAETAPATTLKLVLRGIVAATGGKSGFAIIADAKGRQNYYAVGAKLPEGAAILAVHDDYVVLRHNNRSEILRMPETPSDNADGRKAGEFLPGRVGESKRKKRVSRRVQRAPRDKRN